MDSNIYIVKISFTRCIQTLFKNVNEHECMSGCAVKYYTDGSNVIAMISMFLENMKPNAR